MLNMRTNGKVIKIENLEKINFTPVRKILTTVFPQAYDGLDPSRILESQLKDVYKVRGNYNDLYVIGFGKAALTMYEGVREYTAKDAHYSGIIIPDGETYKGNFPELELLRGTHPFPSAQTEASTRTLMERVRNHRAEDLFIVLISGGGSALFELPESGFTIDTIGETAKCLMANGANIRELNIIRHAMSSVKGGKLASRLYPSEVKSYIISDVPGDDLQLIASGPLTRPDYSEKDFQRIVKKYADSCPIVSNLSYSRPVTLDKENFTKIENRIVLKNNDFVETISRLLSVNQDAHKLFGPVTGNVEEVARRLAKLAHEYYSRIRKPFWMVCGGETTANVKGKGVGGRNCELSLRVALEMKKDEDFLFASIGTDGIDGVSPAMGGITDTWFVQNTSRDDISKSLENSDSYTLLNCKNSAILTGYTGTNVSDIFVLYYGGGKT